MEILSSLDYRGGNAQHDLASPNKPAPCKYFGLCIYHFRSTAGGSEGCHRRRPPTRLVGDIHPNPRMAVGFLRFASAHTHTHTHTHTHIYTYPHTHAHPRLGRRPRTQGIAERACVCVWGGSSMGRKYRPRICIYIYIYRLLPPIVIAAMRSRRPPWCICAMPVDSR